MHLNHDSQVLATVPKKDPKRTFQAYTRTFSLLYGRRFYAIYWLSKLKRKCWSNCILVAWYQYQLTIVGTHLQPKMAWSPLIATWPVYRLLQAVTFAALRQEYNCPFAKYCCLALRLWNVAHKWTLNNNGKGLLTIRKDPWADSKDLKGFYWKINFQGLKRT